MQYSDYTFALQALLQTQDPYGIGNFSLILPRCIEYAENRMYRDPLLDFLATRTTDVSQQTTAGSREVPIPPQFIVIEGAAIIMPAGQLPTVLGAQRVPLLRATRAFMDLTWPVATLPKTPVPFETYFCVYSEEEATPIEGPSSIPNAIRIAPTVDAAYNVEYTGTFQPTPLSAANPDTLLTVYFPDLFLAASMIWMSGWQRLYGAGADDPKLAMSWEAVYQSLKSDASILEFRKKSLIGGGSPSVPNPTEMVNKLREMAQAAPAQRAA